jgi:hypothetical protein
MDPETHPIHNSTKHELFLKKLEEVKYGYLYNWFVVNDSKKISSSDEWEVPNHSFSSSGSSNVLQWYLGGQDLAGGKMKESGFTYWISPNTGANNSSKFNGKGSGIRTYNTGNYVGLKASFSSWTRTQLGGIYHMQLTYNFNHYILGSDDGTGKRGSSIRLVKTGTTLSEGETGFYTGNDGKYYRTICIGTQEWLADNLKETKFRNGDTISVVTDNATWVSLSTSTRCVYDNDENNA